MNKSLKNWFALAASALVMAACVTVQPGPRGPQGFGGGPRLGHQGPNNQGPNNQGPSALKSGGSGRTWDVEQIGSETRITSLSVDPGASSVSISVSGDTRLIVANNIPDHLVGRFPNGTVQAQSNTYRMDATPSLAGAPTYLSLGSSFGIALNGVTFDPLAAEFYEKGGQDWNYVVLNGAIPLSLDTQTGHIQGQGEYHYHGIGELMLQAAGYTLGQHSPLIGYAADGFPIYALYGYAGGKGVNGVREVQSGWVLKSGPRPGGSTAPGGTYDGTFHADYTYVGGDGTLDECNGMTTQTPEYPSGTYAYFLTADYPVVPICHQGRANRSFRAERR